MAMTPNTPSATSPMMARAQMALGQLGQIARQPSIRRALPAIVAVAATGLALAIWLLTAEGTKRVLYPGMAEAEKASVIENLATAGIPAEISRNTGEVEVAANDYYRARMTLAAAGLPQAVPEGQALVTDMPMGTSRSVEAARLRQALETDLARSIMELADVTGARVHLALPEKSAFLRENAPPRASVFLQLARGRAIDPGQVEAVVNLVASSVSGMARQDVTVVDQSGKLLSRGGDDPAAVASDRQLQQRLEVETLYRQRIEQLLTPIMGPGNLSVQVTVDMDFTRQEITSETVDPQATALRSEQTQLQESGEALARGIPGAISNAPPPESELTTNAPPTATENETAAQTATETATETPAGDAPATTAEGAAVAPAPQIRNRSEGMTRNYEVSKTVETTLPAASRIARINAAILLRDTPVPNAEDPELPPVTSIPPELIADMERLVQTAIGFDTERGDSVTVLARPFLDEVIAPETSFFEAAWIQDALKQIGMIGAIAIIAFGIVRPILQRAFTGGEARMSQSDLDGEVEVSEGESIEDVRARLRARQGAITRNMLDAAKSHEEQIDIIRQLVNEDAGRIATTFRQLIAEELDRVT